MCVNLTYETVMRHFMIGTGAVPRARLVRPTGRRCPGRGCRGGSRAAGCGFAPVDHRAWTGDRRLCSGSGTANRGWPGQALPDSHIRGTGFCWAGCHFFPSSWPGSSGPSVQTPATDTGGPDKPGHDVVEPVFQESFRTCVRAGGPSPAMTRRGGGWRGFTVWWGNDSGPVGRNGRAAQRRLGILGAALPRRRPPATALPYSPANSGVER